MNDYENQMYPDQDHVHRWGDDAVHDRPEDNEQRRLPLPGAPSRAIGIGLGISALIVIGIALAIIVLVATGCTVAKPVCQVDAKGHVGPQDCVVTAATEAQYKQFQEKASAEGVRRLKKMHEDMSKEMREHRQP